jgi:thiamine biosynthesis lipoprotein
MTSTSQALPRRAWVEQVMGMPVSVHLQGARARTDEAAGAARRAFATLRSADATFSTYRADSAVTAMRAGRLRLEDAPREVGDVVRLCDIARECTGGLFDPFLPDEQGRRVFDPSGLVKGWAAERAAAELAGLAGVAYCLNAGGDVVVGGTAPVSWSVGIEDPTDRRRLVAVVPVESGAVATSGTAARGAHLVDPRDGSRPSALLSVTVVGPSLMWADVLATAAFVRGADAAAWVARRLGYSALVVPAPVPAAQVDGASAVSGAPDSSSTSGTTSAIESTTRVGR